MFDQVDMLRCMTAAFADGTSGGTSPSSPVAAMPFQASLLDLAEEVTLGALGDTVHRTELGDGAWIDVRKGWVSGADVLFSRLAGTVPWRAERRPMYDRVVDVPRLLRFYGEGEPLPDPALSTAKALLDEHYGDELGEPFLTAGLCLYRDGRDSVAWHGDRFGRGNVDDTMVAIISVGSPRALLLRPNGGGSGRTIRHEVGHGDLLVMGGTCQRTWEHAVPKTAKPVGPRISIQFRTRGVR
jgi:alkylated DNA repair dioxygenase AlkB